MSEFYNPDRPVAPEKPRYEDIPRSYEDILSEGAQPVEAEIVYEPEIPDGNPEKDSFPYRYGGQNGAPSAAQQREYDRNVPPEGFDRGSHGYPDRRSAYDMRTRGMRQEEQHYGTQTAYYEQPFTRVEVDKARQCPACGAPLEDHMRYCPKCGRDTQTGPSRSQTGSGNTTYTYNYNYNYNNSFNNSGNSYTKNSMEIHGEKARNKWVYFFLTVFLGVLGVNHFYEGKVGKGLAYLFTGGFFGIGYLVDIIIASLRLFKSGDTYYIE